MVRPIRSRRAASSTVSSTRVSTPAGSRGRVIAAVVLAVAFMGCSFTGAVDPRIGMIRG